MRDGQDAGEENEKEEAQTQGRDAAVAEYGHSAARRRRRRFYSSRMYSSRDESSHLPSVLARSLGAVTLPLRLSACLRRTGFIPSGLDHDGHATSRRRGQSRYVDSVVACTTDFGLGDKEALENSRLCSFGIFNG